MAAPNPHPSRLARPLAVLLALVEAKAGERVAVIDSGSGGLGSCSGRGDVQLGGMAVEKFRLRRGPAYCFCLGTECS